MGFMGLGQRFLTWVRSILCCSGQVSHLWFGFGKFSLKILKFGSKKSHRVGSKSTRAKDGSTSYLLWVKSMLRSRRVIFFDLGRINFFDRVWSGRVSYLWFGFGIFSLKILKNSIFSLLIKKNLIWLGQKLPRSKTGRPLIYCGSKLCSGWVGLGQGPSLLWAQTLGHTTEIRPEVTKSNNKK